MPRRNRIVLPGVPYHITQRGVDRCEVFSSVQDRTTYLRLLRENLADAEVAILGFCLMTNHVHLVALPRREESLAVLLRRVHGRYAQYFNTRSGRTGHLWQNRFFACSLDQEHLWHTLAYVDRNPMRAGIVEDAAEYGWSSAAAHLGRADEFGVLDLRWRQGRGRAQTWPQILTECDAAGESNLRRCTYAGRPCGGEAFVNEMAERFDRRWVIGRPRKMRSTDRDGQTDDRQLQLIAE